ncbi:MAG: YihY family inner membrane protein [Alphaproteobacteria bacterium]|nr:YihY family inner membrane protein [Alphaproteobacteria bacterium]
MTLDPSQLWARLVDAVWKTDTAALSGARAAWLNFARTLWVVLRDMREGDLNLRAMSLVYTTILSLVPLLAVSFSVLKGFGVHEQLEVTLSTFLEPLGEKGTEISGRIIDFVSNVKAGVLGSVGLALLIWTVVSLMQKIEHAFNFIWHVPEERPFAQRFSGYLSVILIGPVLIFSSAGLTATLAGTSVIAMLAEIEPFGALLKLAGTVLPYLLIVGAFTFIYVFMPNTRVNVLSALVGALVAGLAWHLTGWVFASFVAGSAKYTAIYSAFAALIVFMLWLYVGWLVLLVGAAIAFYHQHPEHRTVARGRTRLGARLMERIGLAVAAVIAGEWRAGRPPPGSDALARRLGLPGSQVEPSLDVLCRAGIIIAAGDNESAGWLPARPPDAVTLAGLLRVLRADGGDDEQRLNAQPAADSVIEEAERAAITALEGRTLADLAAETAPAPGAELHRLEPGRDQGSG